VEFLGNTKRIISEVNPQKITPEQEDESMKTFDKFIESLGIGLVNADILIENSQLRTFENSIRIIRNTDPIDNRPYNCWKMIKSIDSILLSIAEIINKKRSR
jgi:hypothetical protein